MLKSDTASPSRPTAVTWQAGRRMAIPPSSSSGRRRAALDPRANDCAGARTTKSAMKAGGRATRSIWVEADGWSVGVIDQTRLPHRFTTVRLVSLDDAARAIKTMQVRGAPLIGATAAYGVCLALREDASDEGLEAAVARLARTRPTAINLNWALAEMMAAVRNRPRGERVAAAYARAAEICDQDVATNRAIGEHGLKLIEEVAAKKPGERVNILTHCNAGWIATVDRGTALAPIYEAHDKGLDVHVWVDETRPRNQGAALTA